MTGRLLLELPTVLEGAVFNNVINRQGDILLKLLDNIKHNEDIEDYRNILSFIEEWHRNNKRHPFMCDDGCGCQYCRKTREYANLKLSIHRLRRRLDNDYSLYPSERYKEDCAFLLKQERKLTELIDERTDMRIHLGFISKRVLK